MDILVNGEREAGKGRESLRISAVPQTNTGGLVEKTKVSELTLVKELGNTTSVT